MIPPGVETILPRRYRPLQQRVAANPGFASAVPLQEPKTWQASRNPGGAITSALVFRQPLQIFLRMGYACFC